MIFYPLELARTRITADTSPAGPNRTYPTIRRCLSTTLKQVGVSCITQAFLNKWVFYAYTLTHTHTLKPEEVCGLQRLLRQTSVNPLSSTCLLFYT